MKKNIALLFSVVFCMPIQAQEGWTLRQCIDYAIEHNINIHQTAITVEQNKIDVNTAKWARLPNLNGSAGQNWNWGRNPSPDDNGYTDSNSANTSFGLSTNIPIFTGLQISNQYTLSKLNLKAAVEDLKKAKEDIAISVASAYLQVVFNLEIQKIAQGQVVLSQEQCARINRLSELDKASPVDVAEAKARLAQDEMNAVQAKNNHRLALLDLSQLLELSTPDQLSLAQPETLPDFLPLTPPDEIYAEALSSKPGIKAAQYRLDGNEKSIRIAQSNYYPQLSFGAGLNTNFYTVNGTSKAPFGQQLPNNLSKFVGFTLNVPLFNRFTTRNRVRTAKLQQSNLTLQLDNTKKTLYKEIQQAWYNAIAAESKYNSSTSAVNANQEAFRLMTEKYNNGKANAIQYNESKQNLLKALSDKIQAKYDYIFRQKILDFYKGKEIE